MGSRDISGRSFPSPPHAVGVGGPVPVGFPFTEVPPRGSKEFLLALFNNLAGGGTYSQLLATGSDIDTLATDNATVGVIRSVNVYIADCEIAGATLNYWSLRIGDTFPLGKFKPFPMMDGNVSVSFDMRLPIPGGSYVQMWAQNNLPTAKIFGAYVYGWTWPSSLTP